MGKVLQYDAGNLGLNPSELGSSSAAQAARVVGGLYSQAASEKRQIGEGYGRAVKMAGDVAVDYFTHRELTLGAKTQAELLMNKTKEWNDALKDPKADVNDPALAQRFKEQSLTPAIEKWSESFMTEGGRDWARRQSAQLQQHFEHKTTSDMSHLAGVAAVQNTTESVNMLANTARMDWTATDIAIKTLRDSVPGMTKSPTLDGAKARELETHVLEKGTAAIVKAGIQARMEQNPEAGLAMAQDPKYAKYLSGGEMQSIYKDTKRALKADWLMAKQEEELRLKKASETNKDDFLKNLYDPDLKPGERFTAKDILRIPSSQITPETREHLLKVREHEAEKKPISIGRASATALDLIVQVRNGTVKDMGPVDAALANGEIDYERFKQVEGELYGKRTPEGQLLGDIRSRFMQQYGPVVNPKDINGMQFEQGHIRQFALESYARRLEQTMPPEKRSDLYDPTKPEFIGNSPYAKGPTPYEIMQGTREFMKAGQTPPAKAVPAPSVTPVARPPWLEQYPDAVKDAQGRWIVVRDGERMQVKE